MNSIVDELRTKYSADLCISIHPVDVGSPDQVANMFSEIEKAHGKRPDILVVKCRVREASTKYLGYLTG